MFIRKREYEPEFNVWPSFVDVLSSLLIVVIFVIIGFFISQVYLSDALNNSDNSLKNLQNDFCSIQNALSATQKKNKTLKVKNEELSEQIKNLVAEIMALQASLDFIKSDNKNLKETNSSLSGSIEILNSKIAALNSMLEAEKNESIKKVGSMRIEMETAINEKIEELKKIKSELEELKSKIPPEILQNPELLKYRSEFLEMLQNILGRRADCRPIGDRFVFQAEVLFEQGSAELGKNGMASLDKLAQALIEISAKFPKNTPWILRVDGHTDKIPIHNDKFASNWHLSLARALCVVEYLIKKGINPRNLAATGFAEYSPLENNPNKISKNRRIEFRLDQR